MDKIALKDITLISVCGDARFLVGIIKAAKQCVRNIDFGKVKILSNVQTSVQDIEIVKIPSLNQKQYNKYDLCSYQSFGFHGSFNVAAMSLLEKR